MRPFWARTFGFYGGAALGIYAVGVIGVFVFLRTIGYPVSIVHVGLPPLWHKVGQARGWFFVDRANRAFAADRTSEGLLYLENAYQFDPQNYPAGLALAKHLQAGRPTQSDDVFRRLLAGHPDKRAATAQEWFRALLARGNFEAIAGLARDQLLAGDPHGPVWLRALVFAVRRTADDAALRDLLGSSLPHVRIWRPLLETELLLRSGRTSDARRTLEMPWPRDTPAPAQAFMLFHRADTLIRLDDALGALDLLFKFPDVLDAEARITLQLDAYAATRSARRTQLADELLAPRLTSVNLPLIKVLCAHLIRYPDAELFDRMLRKVQREGVPLNTDTAGIWFSLLCTAGAVGDKARLHELTAQLRQASRMPFVALGAVELFFRGETAERRVAAFLPVLPLPLEVTYALHERYGPGGPSPATPAGLPKRI